MKRIWIALAIFLIISALCITETLYAVYVSEKTRYYVEEAQEAFLSGDSISAAEFIDNGQHLWRDNKIFLDIFLAHGSVDAVSLTLTSADYYIALDSTTEFYIECEKTKEQLNNLMDEELPNFQNIF